jgi:hypothetical protein
MKSTQVSMFWFGCVSAIGFLSLVMDVRADCFVEEWYDCSTLYYYSSCDGDWCDPPGSICGFHDEMENDGNYQGRDAQSGESGFDSYEYNYEYSTYCGVAYRCHCYQIVPIDPNDEGSSAVNECQHDEYLNSPTMPFLIASGSYCDVQ